MESSCVLPTMQFTYRKGLGSCDTLFCVSHTLQSALISGQKAMIVQIDFSVAFDRAIPQGILNNLCSVDIGVLTESQSNRSSSLWWSLVAVNLLSSCQEWRIEVFSPVIVPPVHLGAFFYSGEETDRLYRSLDFDSCCALPRRYSYSSRVSETWGDLWGTKLNSCKTKTMIVSSSRTMHPRHPHF